MENAIVFLKKVKKFLKKRNKKLKSPQKYAFNIKINKNYKKMEKKDKKHLTRGSKYDKILNCIIIAIYVR